MWLSLGCRCCWSMWLDWRYYSGALSYTWWWLRTWFWQFFASQSTSLSTTVWSNTGKPSRCFCWSQTKSTARFKRNHWNFTCTMPVAKITMKDSTFYFWHLKLTSYFMCSVVVSANLTFMTHRTKSKITDKYTRGRWLPTSTVMIFRWMTPLFLSLWPISITAMRKQDPKINSSSITEKAIIRGARRVDRLMATWREQRHRWSQVVRARQKLVKVLGAGEITIRRNVVAKIGISARLTKKITMQV